MSLSSSLWAYYGDYLGPTKTRSPSLAGDPCLMQYPERPCGVLSATVNIYWTLTVHLECLLSYLILRRSYKVIIHGRNWLALPCGHTNKLHFPDSFAVKHGDMFMIEVWSKACESKYCVTSRPAYTRLSHLWPSICFSLPLSRECWCWNGKLEGDWLLNHTLEDNCCSVTPILDFKKATNKLLLC